MEHRAQKLHIQEKIRGALTLGTILHFVIKVLCRAKRCEGEEL